MMSSLDMTDEQFVAQSRRRGRKISSLLLLLSISSYFMARMLMDTRLEYAIKFAWTSVGLAVVALLLLVVVMPTRSYLRKRGKLK